MSTKLILVKNFVFSRPPAAVSLSQLVIRRRTLITYNSVGHRHAPARFQSNLFTSRNQVTTEMFKLRCESTSSSDGSEVSEVSSAVSDETPALTEIITIYERMTKGRAQDHAVFRVSKGSVRSQPHSLDQMAEELVALIPTFDETDVDKTNVRSETAIDIDGLSSSSKGPLEDLFVFQKCSDSNLLDFNKYRNSHPTKYTFFSAETNLIQSNTLSGLSNDYVQLLKSKFYWLNITNPTESDFAMLHSSFFVQDLTVADIREKNTEEKIEVFKHYTFISLKLLSEHVAAADEEGEEDPATVDSTKNADKDINLLLFKDFVITLHDCEWSGIRDILGFLNLLCCHTNSILTPNWVLFSVFTELKQDAKALFEDLETEINQTRAASKTLNEISNVMKRIFEAEFQIYTASRFMKPKMNVLRTLETKYDKRLSIETRKLIIGIHDDFREMSHEMEALGHILERSQDTLLGLTNVQRTRESNESSKVMNRISQIALVFLPIQAAAGFFGMNVQVPFQHGTEGTLYFWGIVCGSTTLAFIAYTLRRVLLTKTFWKPKKLGSGGEFEFLKKLQKKASSSTTSQQLKK